MRRNALTLIELLIVIAIMAVLAAILMPVITPGRSRHNAKRSSCQSNLKSIALSLKAYVQDYDEKFPPRLGNKLPGDAGFGWAGAGQPYFRSIQILQCPSEETRATSTTTTATLDFTDYFYNARLSEVSEARLDYISNTILNGDYTSGDATNSATDTITWSAAGPYATRHLDGANFSFADGHVKWLKPDRPSMAPADATNYTFTPRLLPPRPKPTVAKTKPPVRDKKRR